MVKNCKKSFVLSLFLLLLLLVVFALPVSAAENPYFYPGYKAAEQGYLDLGRYVQQITLTVDGVEYSEGQLADLKAKGTPLTLKVGQQIHFNFHFSFNGRAYHTDDPTLLDENASVHTVYRHGTTYLNGGRVEPGQDGILDDSSIMQDNTTANTYLRLDIGWVRAVCGNDVRIASTDGPAAFYQGEGEDSGYLYVYFPQGMQGNVYAAPGRISLGLTITQEVEHIQIPATEDYFRPGQPGWTFEVVTQSTHNVVNGSIVRTYGDILVKKEWPEGGQHPDAKILLHCKENGQDKTYYRVISGDKGSAQFTIQSYMTDCVLEEDMTGLDDYHSTLTVSEDGKTYTYVNSKRKAVQISKKAIGGSEELAGAKLTLYRLDGETETELDSWTSGETPHAVDLLPADYRLRETMPPAGFAINSSVDFRINAQGQLELNGKTGEVGSDSVTLRDPPLNVKLAKVDPAGNALPGAHLTLTDQTTGQLVEEWISGSEPHEITLAGSSGVKLVAGHTYLYAEKAAPSGYRLAPEISFVFNGDGTIPQHGYHLVSMTDQPSTPTPTPKPNDDPTPTPPGSTMPPDSIPDGGPGGPGGPGNDPNAGAPGRMSGIATGDSLQPWFWLAAALLCLVGGAAALHHGRSPAGGRRRREN